MARAIIFASASWSKEVLTSRDFWVIFLFLLGMLMPKTVFVLSLTNFFV